jgi:hypothetical protein
VIWFRSRGRFLIVKSSPDAGVPPSLSQLSSALALLFGRLGCFPGMIAICTEFQAVSRPMQSCSKLTGNLQPNRIRERMIDANHLRSAIPSFRVWRRKRPALSFGFLNATRLSGLPGNQTSELIAFSEPKNLASTLSVRASQSPPAKVNASDREVRSSGSSSF